MIPYNRCLVDWVRWEEELRNKLLLDVCVLVFCDMSEHMLKTHLAAKEHSVEGPMRVIRGISAGAASEVRPRESWSLTNLNVVRISVPARCYPWHRALHCLTSASSSHQSPPLLSSRASLALSSRSSTHSCSWSLPAIMIFLCYVKMHFSYVKLNILRKWSNILCKFHVIMLTLEHSILWRSTPLLPPSQPPHQASYPSLPATRTGLPPHPASHPTMPATPPCLPAFPGSLARLLSHDGVRSLETS